MLANEDKMRALHKQMRKRMGRMPINFLLKLIGIRDMLITTKAPARVKKERTGEYKCIRRKS